MEEKCFDLLKWDYNGEIRVYGEEVELWFWESENDFETLHCDTSNVIESMTEFYAFDEKQITEVSAFFGWQA